MQTSLPPSSTPSSVNGTRKIASGSTAVSAAPARFGMEYITPRSEVERHLSGHSSSFYDGNQGNNSFYELNMLHGNTPNNVGTYNPANSNISNQMQMSSVSVNAGVAGSYYNNMSYNSIYDYSAMMPEEEVIVTKLFSSRRDLNRMASGVDFPRQMSLKWSTYKSMYSDDYGIPRLHSDTNEGNTNLMGNMHNSQLNSSSMYGRKRSNDDNNKKLSEVANLSQMTSDNSGLASYGVGPTGTSVDGEVKRETTTITGGAGVPFARDVTGTSALSATESSTQNGTQKRELEDTKTLKEVEAVDLTNYVADLIIDENVIPSPSTKLTGDINSTSNNTNSNNNNSNNNGANKNELSTKEDVLRNEQANSIALCNDHRADSVNSSHISELETNRTPLTATEEVNSIPRKYLLNAVIDNVNNKERTRDNEHSQHESNNINNNNKSDSSANVEYKPAHWLSSSELYNDHERTSPALLSFNGLDDHLNQSQRTRPRSLTRRPSRPLSRATSISVIEFPVADEVTDDVMKNGLEKVLNSAELEHRAQEREAAKQALREAKQREREITQQAVKAHELAQQERRSARLQEEQHRRDQIAELDNARRKERDTALAAQVQEREAAKQEFLHDQRQKLAHLQVSEIVGTHAASETSKASECNNLPFSREENGTDDTNRESKFVEPNISHRRKQVVTPDFTLRGSIPAQPPDVIADEVEDMMTEGLSSKPHVDHQTEHTQVMLSQQRHTLEPLPTSTILPLPSLSNNNNSNNNNTKANTNTLSVLASSSQKANGLSLQPNALRIDTIHSTESVKEKQEFATSSDKVNGNVNITSTRGVNSSAKDAKEEVDINHHHNHNNSNSDRTSKVFTTNNPSVAVNSSETATKITAINAENKNSATVGNKINESNSSITKADNDNAVHTSPKPNLVRTVVLTNKQNTTPLIIQNETVSFNGETCVVKENMTTDELCHTFNENVNDDKNNKHTSTFHRVLEAVSSGYNAALLSLDLPNNSQRFHSPIWSVLKWIICEVERRRAKMEKSNEHTNRNLTSGIGSNVNSIESKNNNNNNDNDNSTTVNVHNIEIQCALAYFDNNCVYDLFNDSENVEFVEVSFEPSPIYGPRVKQLTYKPIVSSKEFADHLDAVMLRSSKNSKLTHLSSGVVVAYVLLKQIFENLESAPNTDNTRHTSAETSSTSITEGHDVFLSSLTVACAGDDVVPFQEAADRIKTCYGEAFHIVLGGPCFTVFVLNTLKKMEDFNITNHVDDDDDDEKKVRKEKNNLETRDLASDDLQYNAKMQNIFAFLERLTMYENYALRSGSIRRFIRYVERAKLQGMERANIETNSNRKLKIDRYIREQQRLIDTAMKMLQNPSSMSVGELESESK